MLLRRATLAIVFGLLISAVSAGALPATASAGVPAYNQNVQTLTVFPNPGNSTCIQRRIYLAAGNYYRELSMLRTSDGSGQAINGNMYLGTGWYTWRNCIQGNPDWSFSYLMSDILDPDNPNWGTSTWSNIFDLTSTSTCLFVCDFSWGARLQPLDW
jgi:hypothetical protein